jgi:biopolymer transport protein ExbD
MAKKKINLIDENEKEIAEINMTPFVDIVLVILIIFMATATFIVEGKIPLNLPSAETGEVSNKKEKEIVISINEKGVYLDNKLVSDKQLEEFLKNLENKNSLVVLRVDKNIPFEKVVKVIDICRKYNLERYGIETVKKE